jgi:N-methylhydantoinase A/oxoprolinase/acetone carboxylase beta subunit
MMTPVYKRPLLAPSDIVSGAGIVEGGDIVYPVAAGWRVRIEASTNFVFKRLLLGGQHGTSP